MNSFKRLFLNEIFIITIILLNSVLIFLEGFPRLSIDFKLISTLHYLFLIIYVFELIFKINEYGFKNYIKEGLNKLDFVLVLILDVYTLLLSDLLVIVCLCFWC